MYICFNIIKANTNNYFNSWYLLCKIQNNVTYFGYYKGKYLYWGYDE